MGGAHGGSVENGGADVSFAAAPVCANCSAPLSGSFCAQCGQARDGHRRSVALLLRDIFKDIVNFDSRIMRTGHALLIRPGELACAFREGRTRPFVPPVRLYLFVSLIFFLTLSFANIAIMQIAVQVNGQAHLSGGAKQPFTLKVNPTTKIDPQTVARAKQFGIDLQSGKPDPGAVPIISGDVRFFAPIGSVQSQLPPETLKMISDLRTRVSKELVKTPFAGSDRVLQGVEHIAKDPAAINGPLTVWVPRMLFLLVPLFAAVLMAFYVRARKQFFYIDHLVFSLNYFSATFVILLVTAAAAQLFPGIVVAGATLFALGAHLLFAMKRFFGQNWARTALKFTGAMAVYLIFILGPAIVAVIVMSISEA